MGIEGQSFGRKRNARRGAALCCGLVVLVGGCADEVQRSGLPITDDFSGDCAWSEDNDKHIALVCEDGQYRAVYKTADERMHHMIPRRIEAR